MIRFVYPNVNASDQFVGCGRYFATTPNDPCLTESYTIAEPNVGHLSNVTDSREIMTLEGHRFAFSPDGTMSGETNSQYYSQI